MNTLLSRYRRRDLQHGSRKRSAWRERLVRAEAGLRNGVRRDSTLCGHLFTGSIALVAGLVVGLSLIQWAILVLAMTVVGAAEMFDQVLKALLSDSGDALTSQTRATLGLSTAAVILAIAGSVITMGLVFVARLMEMFPK